MSDRETLLALAERCEKATAEEQQKFLEEAFRLCDPTPSRMYATGRARRPTKQWADWSDREERYTGMLALEAYLDAAMTLVPEGHLLQLSEWEHPQLQERGRWQAILVRQGKRDSMDDAFRARCDHAQTSALALAATALRAKAASL